MRSMTRATFSAALAGCVAAAVTGTALLSGCAGSTLKQGPEAQSIFRGSYGGGNYVTHATRVVTAYPNLYTESGAMTMSVDSHGRMTGTITHFDGGVSFIDGNLRNDGNFEAAVSRSSVGNPIRYSIKGRMAQQGIDTLGAAATNDAYDADYAAALANAGLTRPTRSRQEATPTPSPTPSTSPSPSPSASPAAPSFLPGVSGDFRATINGREYAGTFEGIGGQATQ
jgi:hypothetical protein